MQIGYKNLSFALAILLAGALVALLLVLTAGGDEPGEAAPVDVYSPFGLFSPGLLSAMPTSAGLKIVETLGVDSVSGYQNYSLALTKELGVSWVRMDFTYDGWNFIESPDYLEKIHSNGIDVVGCVLPMNSFAPADLALFKASFRDLVHRYPWIRVWQIGNEPDLSWDNPLDYPRFFFAGQQVVRSECPDCKVALAGAGARWPGQDEQGWRNSLGLYDRIIGDIAIMSPGIPKPFDIIDMHFYDFYGTEDGMLETLSEYRNLPLKHGLGHDIEFWVTECATPTGPITWPVGSPVQTEEQQASELVTRFVTMLGAEVKRVAWSRFYENYRYHDSEGGFFDNTGLIYNGIGYEAATGIGAGSKKQAFFAYRTLATKIGGCSRVFRLGPGAYKFFFDGDRVPVYVLWEAGSSALPAGLSGPVVVTDLAGNVTYSTGENLLLSSAPVFVESRPAGVESS